MTGFDSEADRRDAIRQQIVDVAYDAAMKVIGKVGVTFTPEERTHIQMCLAKKLVDGLCMETMAILFRQEIGEAIAKVEERPGNGAIDR